MSEVEETKKVRDNESKAEKFVRLGEYRVNKAIARDLRAIYTKLPRYEARDENFKKIQYTRYCDDFLIGVIGSKEDAEMIKAEVKKFLAEELSLTLSDEKTKITHTSKCADFLGYKIKVSRNDGIKRRKDGVKSRPFSGVVKLYVPKENWIKKLLEYEAIKIVTDENGNERWKAMHSGKVLNKCDIEILSDYNEKVRGLFNYYCIADNAYVIGKFGRAMKYSMMKTFAFKYKTKVSVKEKLAEMSARLGKDKAGVQKPDMAKGKEKEESL